MQKHFIKEPILAKFLRFGIYLTAFVPLIIFKDFISPFHFGKVIVFRSVIEVLGAIYLILVLKNRSYLPRRDKVFWAFFAFTLVFSLTTLTSELKYPSFWGTLERMGGLWTFWHYFLYFIILISIFTKKEHWQKLFDLTIFVGVLSAFYGFGQKTDSDFFLGSGGRQRIFGTIGNAALFAGYELFTVFLSLMMYFKLGNSWNRKIFYALAFGISSVAILMTAVRGSVLGLAVGVAVFAHLFAKNKKSRLGKIAPNLLLILAALFIVFSLLFKDSSFIKNSKYLSRITNLSLSSATVKTRTWAWQAGLKGWSENPKKVILGWGAENFNLPFSKNFNPKFYDGPGSETLFDRAHNMFIEILVTMGIIGLSAYVFIFTALFGYLRRLFKEPDFTLYGIGLIPLIIAYIIHNSFIFDTSANFLVFFTLLGFVSYSHANIAGEKKEEVAKSQSSGQNKILINLFITAAVVLIPILTYKTAVLPAKANYATTRAIVRGWQGDVIGSLEKYKEAISYDVPGKYEYRHRFAQYLVGSGGPSVKEKKVREDYKLAIDAIDQNIKENAIDYLPYLYGSRLNILLGKDDPASPYNDKALEYASAALKISPTFVRTYYELAQIYLNKKDYKTAIGYFQKAVDLNPEVGISHWYLGAAKIDSGDISGENDLESAIKSRYSPDERDLLKLVNIYLRRSDFAKLAETFEGLIIKNPKNAQYYASLATAYVKLGRIDDAVKMAMKAAEIDHSFESDARAFLKSIGREF